MNGEGQNVVHMDGETERRWSLTDSRPTSLPGCIVPRRRPSLWGSDCEHSVSNVSVALFCEPFFFVSLAYHRHHQNSSSLPRRRGGSSCECAMAESNSRAPGTDTSQTDYCREPRAAWYHPLLTGRVWKDSAEHSLKRGKLHYRNGQKIAK